MDESAFGGQFEIRYSILDGTGGQLLMTAGDLEISTPPAVIDRHFSGWIEFQRPAKAGEYTLTQRYL